MKKENITLMDVGHVLGRSEMKKIMAGCGSYCHGGDGSNGGSATDCYLCLGGVECWKITPGSGMHGTTNCVDKEPPEVGCNQSGSSCFVP